MNEEKKPNKRKPMLYYYFIILLIVILLNTYAFPLLFQQKVTQVDYGTFINDVAAGRVKTVEVQDKQITYMIQDAEGKEQIFITGKMDDPELTKRLLEANVKFTKAITKETSPLLNFLLTWIFPLLFFVGLGQLFTGSMQKRMGNIMSFGKSNARVFVENKTGKTFADVAGQDEAKEALKEIVEFLHNPAKYKEIGAVMPKGALLVGPPGTGKTLLAKAVAGESKVPFFSISGSEFVEMFVGMGAARVRDLFKEAQAKAPCIIFIDEIDAIGKKRDNVGFGGNDEREQTLNQLLSEMDGFSSDKGVVILAATNRPESLDKALLRPGRFDRRIPVELPDLNGRRAILEVHARKVKMAPDIDLAAIAKATPGASGAELANIINEAALLAVKYGNSYVTQSDLEEAVEVVIAGYQRKGAVISPKEKRIIAYHEVGHALVAVKQAESAPVHKITIIPRTSGALGFTMQVAEEESFLMSREEAFSKITTYTGGRAAEELVFNTMTSGAANDIEQATKLARAMVTRLGMSKNFDMMALETIESRYLSGDASLTCSSETAAKIDEEVLNIIKEAHTRATQILQDNIDKLHEIAAYLIEKETITGEEFMQLLGN